MPNYRTHQVAGLGMAMMMLMLNSHFGAFALFSFNPVQAVMAMGVILFYSILADVDIGTSVSRKIVLGGGLLAIIFCFLSGMTVLGVTISVILLLMISFLNHRGATHSTLAAVVFSLPLLYMGAGFMAIGLVAYVSHLLIDKELRWR